MSFKKSAIAHQSYDLNNGQSLASYQSWAITRLESTVSPLVALVYIIQWQYTLQLNNVSIPNYIATALSV